MLLDIDKPVMNEENFVSEALFVCLKSCTYILRLSKIRKKW